jgi:lysophospholipid hydrolase
MRELTGGGTTIAVDVSAERDMQCDYPYEDAISGWRILWSRFNRFSRTSAIPSMAAVLQRSAEIASIVMQREALLRGIDLYIRVPVAQFGLLDFDKATEIIAVGRRVAREQLAAWRKAAPVALDAP